MIINSIHLFTLSVEMTCLKSITISHGILACFCPCIIFARCYKKLVFLPQLSVIDTTRQARKKLNDKDVLLHTRTRSSIYLLGFDFNYFDTNGNCKCFLL